MNSNDIVRDRRLVVIDEWRGICVIIVIIHHLVIFRFLGTFNVPYRLTEFNIHPSTDAFGKVAARLFYLWAHGLGPLGVQIFFVISGYVITRLLISELAREGTVCIRCFYIRRAFRILPALVCFMLFVATLSALGIISAPPATFASAATFLCNTTLVNCGYHFSHLWSISIEEQFYLIWPWLYLIIPPRHRISIMWGIFVGCMVLASIPSLRINGWLNNGLSFGCIAAGALYALDARIQHFVAAFRRLPVGATGAGLVIAVPLLPVFLPRLSPLFTLLLPALILVVVMPRAELRADRIKSSLAQGLRKVGLMSYSLYLWHCAFTWEAFTYHSEVFLFISIPLVLALAWLSARYLERYFIRKGREFAPVVRIPPQGIVP